jgi:HEPN domain-containing protein
MKQPRDHAQTLLKKAANDLIAADAILSTERALDTACFHTQQAVEKSLKAILAYHDIEYPWRHDLGELLKLVIPLAPDIAPLADQVLGMTPYAVEIRYNDEFDPGLMEAGRALSLAIQVYQTSAATIGVNDMEWDR